MDTVRLFAQARTPWPAPVSLVVALGAMAVDHLLGTEREEGERGLADPAMFAVSAVMSLVTALTLSQLGQPLGDIRTRHEPAGEIRRRAPLPRMRVPVRDARLQRRS